MKKRTNVLIFNPDQMRADALFHFGNEAAVTPNLDAMAATDAVSFRNAYCQNPVCVPSRCSFTTGLYPHVNGHRTMNHMIHDWETTIFQELKEAGYYIWLNERNDLLPVTGDGYWKKHADYVFEKPVKYFMRTEGLVVSNPRKELGDKDYYSFYRGTMLPSENGKVKTYDDECIEAAIDFIKNRNNKEQPFCMFLGLNNPHPPYQVEEPYFSAIKREKLPSRIPKAEFGKDAPKILKQIQEVQNIHDYSESDWDELRACYLGMCMKVDEQFGQVCQALKEAGLYDDTDIYFFSDHGDFTGDYGIVEKTQNTFQDCLVNVPLLIKPHKGVELDAGISESLVELVDFYATALDVCGVKSTHTHFGKSLRPILADRTVEVRDFVSCEGGRLEEEKHCSEIPTGVPEPSYPYYPRMLAQSDAVCHTKATMLRTKEYKYVNRLYESDELYDLKEDPQELRNLIYERDYQGVVAKMRKMQLDWYQGTCDIVPFKEDLTFNMKSIWENLREEMNLSPEEETAIDEKISAGDFSGVDFYSLVFRL